MVFGEINRRIFLGLNLLGAVTALDSGDAAEPSPKAQSAKAPTRRIQVIDCTDLYHPHQDVGDNFDIIAPYALSEIDLKAVILDVTER